MAHSASKVNKVNKEINNKEVRHPDNDCTGAAG